MGFSSVIGASSVIRPGVCTSTTRPSSPFDGQMIYETDTDRVLVYDGSAWYPPENTSWGRVAMATSTTSQTGVSTVTDITGMSVTFTAVSGRQYKISLFLPQLLGSVSGDRARITITDGSNNSVFIGYTNLTPHGAIVSLSGLTTASGSVTYKARMQRDVGTGTMDSYADAFSVRYLLVEDIGPA